MLKATFSEFRQNAKYFLDAVEEKHERIVIFRHGHAVAQITPILGIAYQPSWKKKGMKLAIKGVSLSDRILKEREQER